MKDLDFSAMEKKWPSDFVARERIGDFTGGLFHPRTMANYDAKKEGVPGKIRVGRKIAYPVHELIKWLNAKIERNG